MTYVVLIWVSDYEETEVKCFSELVPALDYAAEAKEATNDSGGQIQVWAWTGKRQLEIHCQGWLQAKPGRYTFATQWLKARS